MKVFDLFRNIWEYLFAPWEVTVLERGKEEWADRPSYALGGEYDRHYYRHFVVYRYKHKFRNQECIKKVYLS